MKLFAILISISVVAALLIAGIRLSSNGGPLKPAPRIVTAKELLAQIESNTGDYYPEGHSVVALPADELQKVITTLRNRYPIENLAHRLPAKTTNETLKPIELFEIAENSLQEVERNFRSYTVKTRRNSLEKLHGNEVESFINRAGFGYGRRPPKDDSPNALELQHFTQHRLKTIEPNSNHYGSAIVELQPGRGIDKTNGLPTTRTMAEFHKLNQIRFAAAETVGFVKDIKNVAGFRPHKLGLSTNWDGSIFHKAPKPVKDEWKINRVELVSLLLSEEPLVYVADNGELPTMENVADRETRELSEFEARGLKSLADGRDTFISASINRIEMMGAIRAADNCLQCHTGERGKILGAFSYEILRDPVVKPKTEPDNNDFAFTE